MAADPWTDTDVELVARADFEAQWPGRDWTAIPVDEADEYRSDARAVLSALSAAGRLAPRDLRFRFFGEAPFRAMRTRDGRVYHPSDVWFEMATEPDAEGSTE